MSFYTPPAENELDYISNPERLSERAPGFKQFYERNASLRKALWDAAPIKNSHKTSGMSDGGTMMWSLRIPWSLWAFTVVKFPETFKNKREFKKFIRNHPELVIGKTTL